ncbi:hypothetical protein HPB47_017739 [Ixodes persulcatus]|uniref:Uncharacterized protein n=1 Tax=Ixodes persulcatus TaxID=34615 RepID=A0AC60QMK2_IXOPE|nr:hypothetical protein HPB47_017739 [Ixodes persulcatus]
MFATYGVPERSKVHLIMLALSSKAEYLFSRLASEELSRYSAVITAVLEELKVTPEEHRERFVKAMRRKDEGWAQFASRLTSHFSYYIKARETKTLEALIELTVADCFKECLSPEAQRHVTLREEGG